MVTLFAVLVLAQPTDAPSSLFTHTAWVSGGQPGSFARLPLPQMVLREVQPDLSDVRLIDARGQLVPFVVQRHQSPTPASRQWLHQVEAERSERPSGPQTPNLYTERAVFEAPSPPLKGNAWLELEVNAPTFVRTAAVEGLSERGQVLARTEATVFRLSQAEKLTIPLPAAFERAVRLRLELQGQNHGFLSPRVFAVQSSEPAGQALVSWPVSGAPQHADGRTVWVVQKPTGVVPAQLEVSTTTPWFDREVVVSASSGVVGSGRVFRIAGVPGVEKVTVPLLETASPELEVSISDLDSPPLEHLSLRLVVEQPELVFAVPNERVQLAYGGHRTRRPHFDTEQMGLTVPTDTQTVTLEEPVAAPTSPSADVLSLYRRPGAAVEPSRFQFRAPLTVASGATLTSVTFEPSHALTMRADFRDLRVVDAQQRQWPYLLETRSAATPVASTVEHAERQTRLRFTLTGRVTQLELLVPSQAPFFSRQAQLHFEPEGHRPELLWTGRLTSHPRDDDADALVMPLDGRARPPGVYVLSLTDEGDAPLEGLGLQATLTVPTLKGVLEPGSYQALWGSELELAPRYDLEQARRVLEELAVTTAPAGMVERNPSYEPPSFIHRIGGGARVAFWLTLVVAVVFLSVLTLRLARQGSDGSR